MTILRCNQPAKIPQKGPNIPAIGASEVPKRPVKTIVKISSKNLKPLKKIELILEVANDVPNEMIYKAIGISKATFYRHLNYINKH